MNNGEISTRERVVKAALGRMRLKEPSRLTLLKGDASSRKFYRAMCGDTSYIVMDYTHPLDDNAEDFILVRNHLSEYGVAVPEIYCLDEDTGLIALEDLGDITIQKAVESSNFSLIPKLYSELYLLLKRLHAVPINDVHGNPIIEKAFSNAKFFSELVFFEDHFIREYCGITLSPMFSSELRHAYQIVCDEIIDMPFVFTHRDYHSRNVMLKNDICYLIDFQDARWGPILYDAASYLRDAYVQLPEEMIKSSLEILFNDLSMLFKNRRHFRAKFGYSCIQRNLKALGTFGYQATVRRNSRYLRYVRILFEHLRFELKMLENHRVTTPIFRLLSDAEKTQFK